MNHSGCPYHDDVKMTYALVSISNKRILISAGEDGLNDIYWEAAINDDKDIEIDCDSCENEAYQLVYGALMFHDIDKNDAMKAAESCKNAAMISIDGRQPSHEFGKLTASVYDDICFYPELADELDHVTIPFVALMKTLCLEKDYASTTLFPCYQNLKVWESMVNRDFLLSCRKFVKVEGLSIDNWKDHIDVESVYVAYRLAPIYTGSDIDDEVNDDGMESMEFADIETKQDVKKN